MERGRGMYLVLGAIAGGIALLVFGPGFYECITTTTCTKDPCVRCAAKALSPNVQAALLTVTLGGLIAWWYQRANKIMEFRFGTFEKAMRTYTDLSDAAWSRLTALALVKLRRREEGSDSDHVKRLQEELEQREGALHSAILAGHSISSVQSVLFRDDISHHWGDMMDAFCGAKSDDLWAAEAVIYDAPVHWLAYMRGVAQEIRLPFPDLVENPRAISERNRPEVRKLFEQAQPRAAQGGGAAAIRNGGNKEGGNG